MKLTFIGAAHEVTGSCTLLEIGDKNILIDCGMEQGGDTYENAEIPEMPSAIDCVLLTHAHIDHSGLLPLLYSKGFRGNIYSTYATSDLCDLMLRDSAHIQEFEATWRNRKAARSGKEPYVPLYTMDDAIGAIKLFVPCKYNEEIEIMPELKVRFNDAGHLLGSASIEAWATEGDVTKKIVFSGDIGNLNQPILKDPTYLESADYVVMESTYGDRSHGETPDYITNVSQLIQETFDKGGNVVIPSFAVGRTQELLYFLRQIKAEGRVKGYNNFAVYVDSPLAIESTIAFTRNTYDCFDADTMELINKGINPLSFEGLRTTTTSDESRMINFDNAPKIIISASGMCEAGRIRHHLKHNLWRPECTILFVGYQAEGTLGRLLLEGNKSVKLFGETVEVKADIKFLNGVSGHADDSGLIKWISSYTDKPSKVFVVHGQDEVCEHFAKRVKTEVGLDAYAPFSGDSFDLISGEFVEFGDRKRVAKKVATKKHSASYARLLSTAERFMSVVKRSDGRANKDIAKLADQINALLDKWEK